MSEVLAKLVILFSARRSNLDNDIVEAEEVLRSRVSAKVVGDIKRPHRRYCER